MKEYVNNIKKTGQIYCINQKNTLSTEYEEDSGYVVRSTSGIEEGRGHCECQSSHENTKKGAVSNQLTDDGIGDSELGWE